MMMDEEEEEEEESMDRWMGVQAFSLKDDKIINSKNQKSIL